VLVLAGAVLDCGVVDRMAAAASDVSRAGAVVPSCDTAGEGAGDDPPEDVGSGDAPPEKGEVTGSVIHEDTRALIAMAVAAAALVLESVSV
jgi:hypothetical protein